MSSVREMKIKLESIRDKVNKNRRRFDWVSGLDPETLRAIEYRKKVLVELQAEFEGLQSELNLCQGDIEVALVNVALEPIPDKL